MRKLSKKEIISVSIWITLIVLTILMFVFSFQGAFYEWFFVLIPYLIIVGQYVEIKKLKNKLKEIEPSDYNDNKG